MGKKETSQPLRWMFLNHSMVSKSFLVVVVIVLVIISIVSLYELGLVNTCKIQQLDIESKIDKYAKTKDPILCDSLNGKISQFNAECKSDIEIQDCG